MMPATAKRFELIANLIGSAAETSGDDRRRNIRDACRVANREHTRHSDPNVCGALLACSSILAGTRWFARSERDKRTTHSLLRVALKLVDEAREALDDQAA
jgi:hypothetical protein